MKKKNNIVRKLLAHVLVGTMISCAFISVPDTEVKAAGQEGKILNIYTWNDEFIRRVADYYPGYEEIDETSGMINDVKVLWNITPSDGSSYIDTIKGELKNPSDTAADSRIDMFLLEADNAKEIISDMDVCMTMDALGLTESMSNQYEYTQEVVKNKSGKVCGSAWQVCPVLFAYRKSIAKQVFGSDDPTVIQEYVKDWDTFTKTSEKLLEQGYSAVSGIADIMRVQGVWNVSYEKENGLCLPDLAMNWMNFSKYYVDKHYAKACDLWSEEWTDGMLSGNVFGWFGPQWFIDYCLYEGMWGDLAVVEGPATECWGGTWVCVAKDTDNASLCADIIRMLTCDETTMENLAKGSGDFPNNKIVGAKLAEEDLGSDILAGQNPSAAIHANALKINSLYTQVELADEWITKASKYLQGTRSKALTVSGYFNKAKQVTGLSSVEPCIVVEENWLELAEGDSKQLTTSTVSTSIRKGEYTYQSKNSSIATVSNTGVVTAIKKGMTEIDVTDKEGRKARVKVIITPQSATTDTDKISLMRSDVKVHVNVKKGGEILDVSLTCGADLLEKGVDYSLEVTGKEENDYGIWKLYKITGIGKYCGTRSGCVSISSNGKKYLYNADVKEVTVYKKNGELQAQVFYLLDNEVLKEGMDYEIKTIECSENGSTITVKGLGRFEGSEDYVDVMSSELEPGTYYRWGDWDFVISSYLDENDTYYNAKILSYNGTDEDVELPTNVKYNGQECYITGCAAGAFSDNESLKKLNISNSEITRPIIVNCPNIERVRLSQTNIELSPEINKRLEKFIVGEVSPQFVISAEKSLKIYQGEWIESDECLEFDKGEGIPVEDYCNLYGYGYEELKSIGDVISSMGIYWYDDNDEINFGVSLSDGNTVLIEGKDYSLSGLEEEDGDYYFTITGLGKYSNCESKTYRIDDCPDTWFDSSYTQYKEWGLLIDDENMEALVISYEGSEDAIQIPEYYEETDGDKYYITGVYPSAFADHDNISSIQSKPSVTMGTNVTLKDYCKQFDYDYINSNNVENDCSHDYVMDADLSENASCKNGLKVEICKHCGEQKREILIATGEHIFGDWCLDDEEEIAPCMDRKKYRYCINCDFEEEDIAVPATTEHIYGEAIIVKDPTCVKEGISECECTVCGRIKQEAVSKLDHEYGEWDVVCEAICGTDGLKGRECENCGYEQEEIISAENVSHSFGAWIILENATCEKNGKQERICAICGAKESENLPAIGTHTYGDWSITQQPTSDKKGAKTRKCLVCGKTETAEIPTIGNSEESTSGSVTGNGESQNPTQPAPAELPVVEYEKGTEFDKGNDSYEIVSVDGNKGTVAYTGSVTKSKKTVTIPKTVTIEGKTFTVTEIADNAFKGNTKITNVTVSANITKIGKNSFSGCKNLKKITIKSTKLKKIGKNAFKGIHKKAVIKVPKKQLAKYKKLFRGKGLPKTVKIK